MTLFDELEMTTIFSARWEGEDLVFQASDWDQEECPDAVMTFRFRCAKLLELEADKVEDLVQLECMDCELYMVPGGYEFHLILSHPDTDRPPFYYCTIQARTVRIYAASGQELKSYDDYFELEERLEAKYTTKE